MRPVPADRPLIPGPPVVVAEATAHRAAVEGSATDRRDAVVPRPLMAAVPDPGGGRRARKRPSAAARRAGVRRGRGVTPAKTAPTTGAPGSAARPGEVPAAPGKARPRPESAVPGASPRTSAAGRVVIPAAATVLGAPAKSGRGGARPVHPEREVAARRAALAVPGEPRSAPGSGAAPVGEARRVLRRGQGGLRRAASSVR